MPPRALAADWAALTAIGTFTLATITAIALGVIIWLAVTDRRRDDRQRKEDRDYDAVQRRLDRDRDDELRLKAIMDLERKTTAERRAREDEQARQITIQTEPGRPPFNSPEYDLNHRITVSWPVPYTVKQVAAQIVNPSGGGLGIRPIGHAGEPPVTEDDRILYRFWADIPDQWNQARPIIRFVDERGNLYYSYLGLTRRFPQSTDWPAAAAEIDLWARTGPKRDEPA